MLPDLNAPAAATGNSRLSRILLIRPHLCAIVHRDAVLKQAGFIVEIAIPTDIPSVVNHCVAAYAVIVISDGISTEETQRIAMQLRHCTPESKIVIIEGPDPLHVDPRLYDAVADCWSRPESFINAVQRTIAD